MTSSARTSTLVAAAVFSIAAARADAINPRQDYMLFCMGCHGEYAQGLPGRVPPLAQQLARFMRTPQGRAYVIRVPGVSASALSDARIASVLDWLAETFDPNDLAHDTPPFTPQEVATLRSPPLANAGEVRKRVIAELVSTGPAPAASY